MILDLFTKKPAVCCSSDNSLVACGNSLKLLKTIKDKSVNNDILGENNGKN